MARESELISELLEDLKEIQGKLDSIIETLEIMSDEELMESIKKAKNQPKSGNFRKLLKELEINVQE